MFGSLFHQLLGCYRALSNNPLMYSSMLEMYMPRYEGRLGSSTSTRDKSNLRYIRECKLHFASLFCKVELGLKSTS